MTMTHDQPLTLGHLSIGAPPGETIAAAARAGFGSVGIRICGRRPGEPFPADLIGNAAAIAALRQQIAGLGIRLSNVAAYQFYPDLAWDDLARAIETTAALGATILVANGFDHDQGRFSAVFARYCAAAAEHGIRVALEFLPYSGVRNLAQAMRVVGQSGTPNAGILVDALHLDRSGGVPADIAAIDPARIVFAQLCDAKEYAGARTDEALMKEARGARLPLGQGNLPLFDLLDALPAGLELEYEVMRADLGHLSPDEKAREAWSDAGRFMAAYRADRAAIRP